MGDTREIARGLRERDVAVLQVLVEEYQDRLVRYLVYVLGRRDGVDDVVQETWLRVMERGKSYDGRSRFEPWLFTVARHLAIDFLRRRREVSLDAEEDGRAVVAAPVSAEMSPFAMAARTEDAERLAGALQGLPGGAERGAGAAVYGGHVAAGDCGGGGGAGAYGVGEDLSRVGGVAVADGRRCQEWRRSMSDRHLDFEQRIDRSLAGAGTLEEERLVEEHVRSCAACAEYLRASRRAVAGLKGFSFEAGPGLNARVMAAVTGAGGGDGGAAAVDAVECGGAGVDGAGNGCGFVGWALGCGGVWAVGGRGAERVDGALDCAVDWVAGVVSGVAVVGRRGRRREGRYEQIYGCGAEGREGCCDGLDDRDCGAGGGGWRDVSPLGSTTGCGSVPAAERT